MKASRGFTLLEMMIVLVIMATLSVLSSQALQQAIKNKAKLQQQTDDLSQVRDTLKVMERDINLAFHYTDLEMELREVIKKKRTEISKTTTTTQPGTAPPPPGGTAAPIYNPNDPNDPLNLKSENRIDPTTHFVGQDNKMYFVTLNASRLAEGSRQADFLKVGYELQSCRRPGSEQASNSCLVRKTSEIVEGDVTKISEGVALLTDVTEFKLRYFGKGKQDWISDWNSTQGDGGTKDRYPDAVEISLTVEKGASDKKKKISMQLIVPIRFANNIAADEAKAKAERQQNQGFLPGATVPGSGGGL
ncbi:MAG: type II secretion system protein GspJ [Pseudobdellovibrionaceae bacterium]